MAPKSASASARNGSQKPKKDKTDSPPKPKKDQPASSPWAAPAGTSEGTSATYAPGVRPDKRLYDEEQGKLKAEIDALQSKLVRRPRCLSCHFH